MTEEQTVVFKVFEEDKMLDNVIVPITVNADHVFYFSHVERSEKAINICREFLGHNGTNCSFLLLDEESELEDWFKKYPSAIVDMTGSRYILLRLFELANRYHNPIFYFDSEENTVKNYRARKSMHYPYPLLTIEDIVYLGGGIIQKHIHNAPDLNNKEHCDLICKAVEMNLDEYDRFVSYINSVNSMVGKFDGKSVEISEEAVKKIKNYELTRRMRDLKLFTIEGRSFSYRSKEVKQLFEVVGSWLESYLYIRLKQSELFDDVMMSVVIDFSSRRKTPYPVTCELDLLALRDNRLIFISCKSNKVDSSALYEVKLHSTLFGNKLSSAAVCTAEELDRRNPSIYTKARELGIAVVDRSQLKEGHCAQALLDTALGEFEYEEVRS
ncbi:MAG: DUF1887 family CARF protein [Erysipelotrichaceae bacterium]|nr:DUF1887 family CARF protein [Erysipelotrichaceae bacterium]